MLPALKNIIIILALVTVTTGCGDLDSEAGSSSRTSSSERGAALLYAEKYIQPALKAPTTADFPWEEIKSTKLDPITDRSGETAERWRVIGAVDAQNSFGAIIRSWWTMEIIHSGGNYMLGTAALEGQTIFEASDYRNLVTMSEAIEANPIKVEGCRVSITHPGWGGVVVEVEFIQPVSDTSYAEAAVRSAMDQAVAQMPDRNILALAFNLNGNYPLASHVYGGELYYDPVTQIISTDSEEPDYKTERTDHGDYLVVIEERGTATGITPARKWLHIKLIWPDESPTSNAARRVIERENSRYKSRGVDMDHYIYTGDFDNPASWVQVKKGGSYMYAEYDAETRELAPSWDW